MVEHKEWNKENVKSFIISCREDEGIPMFRTRYAGSRLRFNGKNVIMGVCWAGHGNAPNSVVFTDVPEDDVRFVEKDTDDYIRLSKRFGFEKELKEVNEAHGIFLRRFKLPKFG